MDLLQLILAGLLGSGATVLVFRPGKKYRAAQIYPATHVSFDHSANDDERLRLLDEARAAVLDGRLSQSNQLKDDGATNEAGKPGGGFEN